MAHGLCPNFTVRREMRDQIDVGFMEAAAAALACRPLGQVETVGVIDLGASRPLAGDDLAAVAAAEALVLPLLGHHLLGLLLPGDPPLPFLQLLGRRLVLQKRKSIRMD